MICDIICEYFFEFLNFFLQMHDVHCNCSAELFVILSRYSLYYRYKKIDIIPMQRNEIHILVSGQLFFCAELNPRDIWKYIVSLPPNNFLSMSKTFSVTEETKSKQFALHFLVPLEPIESSDKLAIKCHLIRNSMLSLH